MRGPSSAGNPVRVLGPPAPPFGGVGWGRGVGSSQFWTRGTGMLSFSRDSLSPTLLVLLPPG